MGKVAPTAWPKGNTQYNVTGTPSRGDTFQHAPGIVGRPQHTSTFPTTGGSKRGNKMGVRANRSAASRGKTSHEAPPSPPPRSHAAAAAEASEQQLERTATTITDDGSDNSAMRRPSPSASATRRSERRLSHKAACKKGDKFVITSRSFPMSEGCYSPLTHYNGEAMYSPSGDSGSSNYVVGATQGDNNDPCDFRWSLVFADSGNAKESFSLCQSVQSASTTHPANAMWACDLSDNGEVTIVNREDFSVSCGCPSTPGGGGDGTTEIGTRERLDSPTPTLRSRAVGCGVIFGFGVFSACFALALRLAGRRKKFRQEQPKYVRIATADDTL